MGETFHIEILPQPDDSTCGPTCLQAVYRHLGDPVELEDLIREIPPLETGGTLAVHLACHALRRGYPALICTYNLHVFDPSWFGPDGDAVGDLASRLEEQASAKRDPKLRTATSAYLEFLSLGGAVRWEELSVGLLRRHLDAGQPLLTGLSATYLYRCAREAGTEKLHPDPIAGYPVGHFVVLYGYDPVRDEVRVADPLLENPEGTHHYAVAADRVLAAILLGVITYDANFLVIAPRDPRTP